MNSLKRIADILSNTHVRSAPNHTAILGIEPGMADEFTTWVQGALELGLQDDEIREHYASIIRNSSWNRSSTGKRTEVTISSHSCWMPNLLASPFRCQSFEAMSVHAHRRNRHDVEFNRLSPVAPRNAPEDRQRLSTSPTSFRLRLKNFSARIHR